MWIHVFLFISILHIADCDKIWIKSTIKKQEKKIWIEMDTCVTKVGKKTTISNIAHGQFHKGNTLFSLKIYFYAEKYTIFS